MDMPAGIAATLDRLAAAIGSRATTVCGVPDLRGCGEACHAHRRRNVIVAPAATQDVHSSPDLRA